MKKLGVGIILAIVLLGGIILISYNKAGQEPTRKTNGGGSVVLASEHDSYDFGKISMANGKVTHTFKMKNDSGKDINITWLYTSCMCTVASIKYEGKVIGPYGMPGHGGVAPRIKELFPNGAEAEVEVTFDPAAHGPAGIGRIERSVIIENDGGEPLEFVVKANVTP